MQDTGSTAALPTPKPIKSVMDKVLETFIDRDQTHSLTAWVVLYFKVHVHGAPDNIVTAKRYDLEKFLCFFKSEIGHDHVDSWTPAVSKRFQKVTAQTIVAATKKPYEPTSVNRIFATIRHFAKWLHRQRPLLAGDPMKGVRDLQTDDPDWNGLTAKQVMRLKSACEQRLNACKRKDQNPLLETAVFYALFQTGLRESELVALNVHQYHHRGLHNVVRSKNKKISKKVPLPQEAREFLDRYLETHNAQPDEPLFISRYGNRLATQDVYRLCQRLLKQALAYLKAEEKFHFTPHKLRHTFLKSVTDKHGIHFTQQMSGNVSIRVIFRYAKPSQDEIDQTVEELF